VPNHCFVSQYHETTLVQIFAINYKIRVRLPHAGKSYFSLSGITTAHVSILPQCKPPQSDNKHLLVERVIPVQIAFPYLAPIHHRVSNEERENKINNNLQKCDWVFLHVPIVGEHDNHCNRYLEKDCSFMIFRSKSVETIPYRFPHPLKPAANCQTSHVFHPLSGAGL